MLYRPELATDEKSSTLWKDIFSQFYFLSHCLLNNLVPEKVIEEKKEFEAGKYRFRKQVSEHLNKFTRLTDKLLHQIRDYIPFALFLYKKRQELSPELSAYFEKKKKETVNFSDKQKISQMSWTPVEGYLNFIYEHYFIDEVSSNFEAKIRRLIQLLNQVAADRLDISTSAHNPAIPTFLSLNNEQARPIKGVAKNLLISQVSHLIFNYYKNQKKTDLGKSWQVDYLFYRHELLSEAEAVLVQHNCSPRVLNEVLKSVDTYGLCELAENCSYSAKMDFDYYFPDFFMYESVFRLEEQMKIRNTVSITLRLYATYYRLLALSNSDRPAMTGLSPLANDDKILRRVHADINSLLSNFSAFLPHEEVMEIRSLWFPAYQKLKKK